MTIRILCAVDDPDTAMALTNLVPEFPDVELGQFVADSTALLVALGSSAAQSIEELPEVVLIDERIGPRPALELIREVALRFPAVGVVLLSADPGPALYSAALDSGARAVVGLPLFYDELAPRIQAAAEWASGVRRHFGAGDPFTGLDWQTVTVTMALAPFVQALASSFGTKLAGAIDDATRSAMRRFVRRQGESAQADAQTADEVMLRLEGHGVRVKISEDTPAEALGQLPAVDFAMLEGFSEDYPVVAWFGDAWCARGVKEGSPLVSAWDPAAGRWSHQAAADG